MLEMWRDKKGVHSGIKTLRQNGDFRSPECIELLEQADVIVTNPPFSIAREYYIPQLFEYNKQFLIIGDLNWITYKNIFPLLKDNKMWLGYNTVKAFIQPDGSLKKFGNKLWFTNLDIKKRHEEIILYKNYSSNEYPTFDELPNIINVDKITDIPIDYNGMIAVPISFLDKYNPDQFEIIDALNRYTILDYWGVNESVKERHSHCCNINGQAKYYRIVVRKKQ